MANPINGIKVQQPWEWSQEGQLRVSVTVTLPSYPANRNIMEDFCSFRSLDFGDVRILQLGVRRYEDATRQWLALVVGVRGRAQDGRDPYIEKEVREVHPGQHFHIDLVADTAPINGLQRLWLRFVADEGAKMHVDSHTYLDLPLLFDGLHWEDYPRILTPYRSELVGSRTHKGRGRETIDFEFTGHVHHLQGRYGPVEDMAQALRFEPRMIAAIYIEDYEYKITAKIKADVIFTVGIILGPADTCKELMNVYFDNMPTVPGPLCFAVVKRPGEVATQIDYQTAMVMTLADLYALAGPDGVHTDGEPHFYIEFNSQIN